MAYEKVLNRGDKPMAYEDVYTGVAGVEFALSDTDVADYKGLKYAEFQTDYHKRGLPAISDSLKRKFGKDSICYQPPPTGRPSPLVVPKPVSNTVTADEVVIPEAGR